MDATPNRPPSDTLPPAALDNAVPPDTSTPCPYHFHVGCVREDGCVCDNPEPNPEAVTPEIGSLVPQKHGGALRYGSTTPGPGRPKALVRQKALEVSEESIAWLKKVRDGEELIDFITKYGLRVPIKPEMRDRLRAAEVLNVMAGLDAEDADDAGSTRRTLLVRIVHE
jgi:hypothetical protein